MLISVINQTNGRVSDEDLQTVIRAINHQLEWDYRPQWGARALLRLEARVRGDAAIYIVNGTQVDAAVESHERLHPDMPYGFVFPSLSESLDESWSVTFSHETIGLTSDPAVNLLVAGPHPIEPERTVLYWYELGGAVQDESYLVQGVEVSNFLLPAYFFPGADGEARCDYLGRVHSGRTLAPFGVNPGGYVGFLDPLTGKAEVYSARGDRKAAERVHRERQLGGARRLGRRLALRSAEQLASVSRRLVHAASARPELVPIELG